MATSKPGPIYQRVPAKTATGNINIIISTNVSTGTIQLSEDIPGISSKDLGKNENNIPVPFAEWSSTNRAWQAYDPSVQIGVDQTYTIQDLINQNSESFTKNAATLVNKNYPNSVEDRSKFLNLPGVWDDKVASTSATGASPTGASATGASATEPISGISSTFTKDNAKNIQNTKVKLGRGKFESLRYPENLEINTSDIIKFTMVNYKSKGFDENFLTLSKDRPQFETTDIMGTVVLSIQPRISDTNQVNWQESNMDAIGVGLAQVSLNTIENGFDGTKASLDKFRATVESEQDNMTNALKIYFAGQAASTQNLLGRLTGSILNPNLELLFDGPTTRTFNYNFTFSPRKDTEAKMVAKIIRFFKEGMAVQRSETSLFLKSPYVFNIEYLLNEGKDHPYINRIKGPCALTNCGVDYTPSGSYMTYSDGSMISYNVNLTFQELDPIYLDDYKDIPLEEIGY